MKRLLSKVGLPRAIGLCIDDDGVVLSQVASTPLGPVEITEGRGRVGDDDLPDVLRRLLVPLLRQGRIRQVPVAVGLPSGRVCFLTRPVQTAASDPSPEVLLHEALRSSNISTSEMVVDVVNSEPDQRPVAGIASCSRKYLGGLLGVLRELGVRQFLVEPAPCALLRIAASRHRAHRGVKVAVRLFLGETQVLAVLVVGNQPIAWRSGDLPRGDETSTLLSVSRCVLAVKKDCGIESPLDAVMVHGRSALARLVDVSWIQQQMGVPLEWFEGPSLCGSQVAFGLALGCLRCDPRSFDLARSLKPRASLWELFPWREVALQTVLLLLMAVFLYDRWRSLDRTYLAVRLQNAQRPWVASAREADLMDEKKRLGQKVAAVQEFLGTRMIWSSYERDLAECLPPEVSFSSFAGVYELKLSGKKKGYAKPKKELVLRGASPITRAGLVPPEIDDFLDTLRGHPMLQRDFPVVELADLKQVQRRTTEIPRVMFTVICLPHSGGKVAKPADQSSKHD